MRTQKTKISKEFWEESKNFITGCKDEELRILRIMAATELEKRLDKWDEKLSLLDKTAKAKKAKAIKRKVAEAKI